MSFTAHFHIQLQEEDQASGLVLHHPRNQCLQRLVDLLQFVLERGKCFRCIFLEDLGHKRSNEDTPIRQHLPYTPVAVSLVLEACDREPCQFPLRGPSPPPPSRRRCTPYSTRKQVSSACSSDSLQRTLYYCLQLLLLLISHFHDILLFLLDIHILVVAVVFIIVLFAIF